VTGAKYYPHGTNNSWSGVIFDEKSKMLVSTLWAKLKEPILFLRLCSLKSWCCMYWDIVNLVLCPSVWVLMTSNIENIY
jgi:hypothetical protein